MAERKRPRRTRERILETSLALFNRHGAPSVTTAHIADEMNISPGNLYYHFRNKDQIVGELFTAYETSVAPVLSPPGGGVTGVEDLWLSLHLLFERMWAYRFIFRDLDELASRNSRLASRFAALTRAGESTVIQLCRGLVDAGSMHATEREIAALAANVVIVTTYWMSYHRIVSRTPGGGDGAPADPRRAAHHVLALIAPYLVGEARALIDRLGHDYL